MESPSNKGEEKSGRDDVEEEDEDVPQLSATALAALQEFYAEQESLRELLEGSGAGSEVSHPEGGDHQNNGDDDGTNDDGNSADKLADKLFAIEMGKSFPEDWQLSQFWYDEETSKTLAKEVLRQAGEGKVACISCPSIFRACENSPNVILFEYDKRFKAFGSSFHFYDYNEPEKVPDKCKAAFSVVVADPPFLSEECQEKVALTVKKLIGENGKIILCTGAVMEPVAERVLGLKRSSFVPQHKHNLGNEFACFTNYDMALSSSSSTSS